MAAPRDDTAAASRRRRRHLLDDLQDLSPPRYPVAPHAVEIGDQWSNLARLGRRLRLRDIGELVEGVMRRRVGPAPAAPAAPRPEIPDRPRQVIGRIPVIK